MNNKLIYAIALALAIVLFIPANALAQPTNVTDPRFERYRPIIVDTECFFYGTGCDEFEQDPSGSHYYDTQTGRLFKYKPINDVPLCHDPYYIAGRLGSTCHDEGDETTSNNATDWVDPMPKVWEEPEPCTPDGPECPPCPEGVEAGWCQDEDERQDTGDDESEGGGGEDDGSEDEGGDGGDSVDPFDGLGSFPDDGEGDGGEEFPSIG